ncbi:MAG: hypothetical protein AAFQ41_13595 [Cyanobacteria bacterium J06623_7]
MNQAVAKSIKVISSLAMTGALGLSGWNLYLHLQGQTLPTKFTALFWLASAALVAHGVEGLIAAVKVRGSDRHPFVYGVYTFFVGFVGLQELKEVTDAVD